MKYKIIFFYILVIVGISTYAHAQTRYQTEIFSSYDLISDIQYGRAIKVNGTAIDLFLDFYAPSGDTVSNRPLVIFIHGGGFKDGDKVSNFGTRVCSRLARRGYVVASLNYRLGTNNTDKGDYEAMIRAVQDAKAAVRFFRKYSNLYRIDTSQVFATGSSAGSITALHLAYLDQDEIPSYVDMGSPGIGGILEGTSGNPGYSSLIQGVISNWGALVDYQYMENGDPPVFCVHGLNDTVVPADSSFSDGPFKYGSIIINQYALSLGVTTGIRLFANTGHTLDNSVAKQDSAIYDFSNWLFTVLKINTVNVDEGSLQYPHSPILYQNYPNPFNPETNLSFKIDKPQAVKLSIYNISGELIETIVDNHLPAGIFSFDWMGKNVNGKNLSSGVYIAQLSSSKLTRSIKMLLAK